MRAPLNTTCDIYAGPGTGTPGALKFAGVPCRLVPDDFFVDVQAPLSASLAYLNTEGIAPDGPTITDLGGGVYTYDFSKADRVIVATFPLITWLALRVESCTWPDPGAPYLRASLAQDEPAPTACSLGYAEVYHIIDYFVPPQFHDLYRTGPTTWEGDGYTLEAETTEPDEDCFSRWHLTDGTREWEQVHFDGVLSVPFDPILPNTDTMSVSSV